VAGQQDERVCELGILSGESSRFASDSNISHQGFRSVYKSWVENCISGSSADIIFIAHRKQSSDRDVGSAVGMVCAKKNSDCTGTIVLLSVSPLQRRQGIGKFLVSHVLEWFFKEGIRSVTVATQKENTSAVGLYGNCGGIECCSSVDVHLWLGEDAFNDPENSEIPNSRPFMSESGKHHAKQVLETGMNHTHWQYGPKCEKLLEEELGAKKCLLTTSGTSALELSALAVGCVAGDEIIMPAFTFVSTAAAYVNHGAMPVFVDIRKDTQNIDETKIEAAITSRTKAVVCVHYAGVSCEMDVIMSIAKKYNIFVIEDNAHGLFGTYNGRQLGSIGDIGCLSFHYTKNFSCGEGGALVVNNANLVQKSMIAWEKGTNRYDFLSGKVSKYYWVDKGGSFVLSELCAALLYGQLNSRDNIQQSRLYAWNFYHEKLKSLEDGGKLTRPRVPPGCVHNAHIYYIRLKSVESGERLAASAKEHRIGIFTHYEPLHLSAGGQKFAKISGKCLEAVDCSKSLYRLPLWVGISHTELNKVVQIILAALDG